jgi:hypothetical protein
MVRATAIAPERNLVKRSRVGASSHSTVVCEEWCKLLAGHPQLSKAQAAHNGKQLPSLQNAAMINPKLQSVYVGLTGEGKLAQAM